MRPMDARPVDHLTLVDLVRLDMQRYGARFVRAEFAGGTVLVALPALAVLAVVVTRPQMAPVGRLLLLAIGVVLAGWLLNGLTLLAIACRQDAVPGAPDDPGRTHRAVARLVRLLLIPGSLPLIALWQARRHA